jgi:xylulokinase
MQLSARLLPQKYKNNLSAIVVCGNGPTILPIDSYGEPLASALTWLDHRAQKEAEEASRVLNYPLDAAFNLPKILWIRRNLPSLYERTAYFISCPEFIIGRLTGEWRTCLPNEGYTRIVWDSAAIDSLGLDSEKFPHFSAIGEIVGNVSASASEAFGFPSKIPVVMGGPDFIASLLGTATVEPGRTCDKGGTSEGINLCSEKGVENIPALLVMPHIIAPYFNISGVISTSGAAVSWFRDTFIATKQYESMYRMASIAKPGAGGLVFLPYLAGERSPHWDPDARALFLGLGLQNGLSEMSRAVLEGTAFAMRDVLDSMESAGATVSDMRATGLPSLSPIWNQIKADITGKRVMVSSFSEPELAGCFAIGSWALGEANSLKEASERIFIASSVFEPSYTTKQLYDELYLIYRESYRRLATLFPKLSNVQRRLEEETHE